MTRCLEESRNLLYLKKIHFLYPITKHWIYFLKIPFIKLWLLIMFLLIWLLVPLENQFNILFIQIFFIFLFVYSTFIFFSFCFPSNHQSFVFVASTFCSSLKLKLFLVKNFYIIIYIYIYIVLFFFLSFLSSFPWQQNTFKINDFYIILHILIIFMFSFDSKS